MKFAVVIDAAVQMKLQSHSGFRKKRGTFVLFVMIARNDVVTNCIRSGKQDSTGSFQSLVQESFHYR